MRGGEHKRYCWAQLLANSNVVYPWCSRAMLKGSANEDI